MDTGSYFIAGYAVILISIIGYVVSLGIRWRNLKRRNRPDNKIG